MIFHGKTTTNHIYHLFVSDYDGFPHLHLLILPPIDKIFLNTFDPKSMDKKQLY